MGWDLRSKKTEYTTCVLSKKAFRENLVESAFKFEGYTWAQGQF